jgi:hypothetical protein
MIVQAPPQQPQTSIPLNKNQRRCVRLRAFPASSRRISILATSCRAFARRQSSSFVSQSKKALDYCLLPAVESATIGDLTVLAGRSLPSRRVRVCRRNEGMRVAVEPTELIGRTVVAEEECPDLTVRDD